jgi:hypothetical protein
MSAVRSPQTLLARVVFATPLPGGFVVDLMDTHSGLAVSLEVSVPLSFWGAAATAQLQRWARAEALVEVRVVYTRRGVRVNLGDSRSRMLLDVEGPVDPVLRGARAGGVDRGAQAAADQFVVADQVVVAD